MSIRYKEGDLLEATEFMIAHQVNCLGAAGGLAAAVFDKWPEAGREYQTLVKTFGNGRSEKLLGGIHISTTPDYKIVVDLFGQYYPGEDYRPYALRSAFRQLASLAYQLDAGSRFRTKFLAAFAAGTGTRF